VIQDHERHREADQRVGDFDAEADDGRAGEDTLADERVDAGMVAVGDEGGAVEPPSCPLSDAGGDFVPDVAATLPERANTSA
jgi:hypothetical protein